MSSSRSYRQHLEAAALIESRPMPAPLIIGKVTKSRGKVGAKKGNIGEIIRDIGNTRGAIGKLRGTIRKIKGDY